MKTIEELKADVERLEKELAAKKARDAEASNPERVALEKRIRELEAELNPPGAATTRDLLEIFRKGIGTVPREPQSPWTIPPYTAPQWPNDPMTPGPWNGWRPIVWCGVQTTT